MSKQQKEKREKIIEEKKQAIKDQSPSIEFMQTLELGLLK